MLVSHELTRRDFVTAAGAWFFTASAPDKIVIAWYDGIWAILSFAMQMALILATGVALADAPLVKRVLHRIASFPRQQTGAAVTVFLASAIGSWLNWGFGLVVGAILAREVANLFDHVGLIFGRLTLQSRVLAPCDAR